MNDTQPPTQALTKFGAAAPRQHIGFLDGLRGVAVLLVIVVHVNGLGGNSFGKGGLDSLTATILGVGWVGVDLFFVLSGFLITRILFDAKQSSNYFRNFYVRRALRIMPLYFGYLILVSTVLRSVAPIDPSDLLSLVFYYYNFRVAWTELPQELCHIFWSLCIEEHFYLVWPFCVLYLRRESLEKICLLGVAFSLLVRVYVVSADYWLSVAYFITPCRLDGLLMGSFLALTMRRPYSTSLSMAWWVATLASLVLLIGVAVSQGHFYDFIDTRRIPSRSVDSKLVLTLGLSCLAVFFSGLLWLLLHSPRKNLWVRIFESKVLTRVGKYSFGIYILHGVVLKWWATLIAGTPLGVLSLPGSVVKGISFVVVSLLTLIVAALVYHVFEEPFLKLKSKFPT